MNINKSNNNLSEMSENINILLDKAIAKYLSSDSLPEQCRLNNDIYIQDGLNLKAMKLGRLYSRFFISEVGEGFGILIQDNDGKKLGSINCVYNENTNRFNICHRLVLDKCPIRGKEIFELLEYFIKGVSVKFPNLKGREIYSRQKQVINRATEKLGFEIDYNRSNELGQVRINNPNSEKIKTITAFLGERKSNPILGLIVSSNLFDKDEIPVLQNLDGVADIVLTKSL